MTSMLDLDIREEELQVQAENAMETRDPDLFDRLYSWTKAKVVNAKREFAKSRFESQIEDILKIANAHKAKNVDKGDAIYLELWLKAKLLVEGFCNEWGGDAKSILTSNPALRELNQWAYYNPEQDNIKKFKLVITCIVLGSIGIGVIGAIVNITYHLFTFWISK